MMLKFLKINNIALIESLKVDFGANLNVLSGETGAGKSIIIDALSFVLGGKFDKNLVRFGQNQAQVSAFFDEVSPDLDKVLGELGLDQSSEILLFRKFENGKFENKINGENVPLAFLKQVASCLIDIHGQNENQRIISPKNQLEILDEFCGKDASILKEKISNKYGEFLDVKKEILKLGGAKQDRERALDFLKYQIKEIEDARLKENEDEDLTALKNKMMAGEKIADNLDNAINVLSGTSSIDLILSESISSLSNIAGFDSSLQEMVSRIKSCKIEIDDCLDEMQSYRKDLDFNEFEFNKIDARLDLIKMLKKKYGNNVEEIKNFLIDAKKQVDEIENSEENLIKKEKQKTEIEKDLMENANALSALRKEFAKDLETKICVELNSLAMKNARFVIDFKPCEISKNGIDNIEFLFSANAGQEIKPLGKIISGGEMSRFCLALKNITILSDGIPSMVFDEVDTGISGKVAEIVAEKMVKISRNKQVLAITHLPQIVAMADCSLFIEKSENNGQTSTSVKTLNKDEHIKEVARLIGANMASLHANEHAFDLVEFGNNFKKSL